MFISHLKLKSNLIEFSSVLFPVVGEIDVKKVWIVRACAFNDTNQLKNNKKGMIAFELVVCFVCN